jgi:hypothetical protein
MATNEERMKILKMIQEGKISPDEGVELLEVLDAGSTVRSKSERPSTGHPESGLGHGSITGQRGSARWFRVQVTDTKTGRARVNVRLPVGLVSAGVKMGARFAPQVEGLDPEELMGFLHSGATGKIVDVYDEDDEEHVEVFIE